MQPDVDWVTTLLVPTHPETHQPPHLVDVTGCDLISCIDMGGQHAPYTTGILNNIPIVSDSFLCTVTVLVLLGASIGCSPKVLIKQQLADGSAALAEGGAVLNLTPQTLYLALHVPQLPHYAAQCLPNAPDTFYYLLAQQGS